MTKYIFLSIFILNLISCNNKTTENTTEIPLSENLVELTKEQLKNSKIEMGKIERKSISSILKVNGKIDVPPQNMVSVSAPLGGYLKSTKLLEGMHIRKGEVIATFKQLS